MKELLKTSYGFRGVPRANEGYGAVDMGYEFPFELVVHLERDIELAAGVVFSILAAMGAAIRILGRTGAHCLYSIGVDNCSSGVERECD